MIGGAGGGGGGGGGGPRFVGRGVSVSCPHHQGQRASQWGLALVTVIATEITRRYPTAPLLHPAWWAGESPEAPGTGQTPGKGGDRYWIQTQLPLSPDCTARYVVPP